MRLKGAVWSAVCTYEFNYCMCLLCFQVLWKSYIDFEIEQEEFGNTRNLYKRLLQRTQHVKVRKKCFTNLERFEFLIKPTKHLL